MYGPVISVVTRNTITSTLHRLCVRQSSPIFIWKSLTSLATHVPCSVAGQAIPITCAHPGIEPPPWPRWPPVSGAVQRHPGREGRVSARVDSVCRPEPGAGGEGRCAGALVLEQPSGDDSRGAATDLVGGGRATLSPFGASREAVRRRYRSFVREGVGETTFSKGWASRSTWETKRL